MFGVTDLGERPVELRRQASAAFRLETSATGAPLPWVLITRLTVTLPGLHTALSVPTYIVDGLRHEGRYVLVITAVSNRI